MRRLGRGALALVIATMAAGASAQTTPSGSGLAPTAARPGPAPAAGTARPGGAPAGGGVPSSAAHPQPTPSSLRMSAEAEAARRTVDERLRRRDEAARRAMQGICKGC